MVNIGLGGDDYFGLQLILSDDILDRIVDLTHHFKAPDVKSLYDQTSWHYAVQYREYIVKLINIHVLPPSMPSLPQPALKTT